MAAAGFTPIQIYYSTTASAIPTAGNLLPGELGLNIADMKLYCENSSGTVTLLASAAGASGDVVGPASATDTAIALFDGATGKLIKNSGVTVDGSNNLTLPGQADLRLADSDSSNWVAFQAPATIASNVTWTLPDADGSNGQTLVTNGAGTLSWATGVSLATPLAVVGNATAGAEIRLPEDTDNGSNYVALKAPNTLASNLTFTLPSVDGTSGQALVTDGSGNLSFGSAGISTGKSIAMAMIFGF